MIQSLHALINTWCLTMSCQYMGDYNKIPCNGLLNNKHLFLTVWRPLDKSKIKVRADLVPDESPLPGLQTAVCPHLVARVRALVSLRLIEVLMPSWGSTRITSFKSNYLAKAPPPNTIPLIRFQLVHFGGHRHSVYNTCIHKVIDC